MPWQPKPKPRDVQRRRLYHAERQVSAYKRDLLPTIPDIELFVDQMLASHWLRTQFTPKVLEQIRVVSGRQNRTAYACGSTISMPRWARSKFIVIHEVCHVVCDRYFGNDFIAGHGVEFATLQVAMVTHFLGEQDGRELHQAFMRYGVKHTFVGGEWAAAG
jgi:hypothetical protein